MVMAEQMESWLHIHNSCIQEVVAIMIVGLSLIFATIENAVWRLVGNENVSVFRNVPYVLVVGAVHDILHEHWHAIELHAVNHHLRVAEVMHILRQSVNLVRSIHTHIMVACDKHLMLVRQVAEPLHEVNSLFLRATKRKVTGMDDYIGSREIGQLAMQTVGVGDVENGQITL